MARHKLTALALLAAACFTSTAALSQEDAVVARIGAAELRASELDLAVQNLDPQLAGLPDEQKKVAALSNLINVKLLANDAATEGLDASDDFKARLAYIRDRELHNAYFRKHILDAVSAEDVKARYDKVVAELPKEEEVRASHILVKTEEEAKAIIADLDAGKDFAELAKEKSQDSNKDDGGDLGWFGRGRMVPEFEEAAFALEKDTYTKAPVQSSFGFHVIRSVDRRVAEPPALEEVQDQVRELVMRDRYVETIGKAKETQGIEILDADLKKEYDEVSKLQDGAEEVPQQ